MGLPYSDRALVRYTLKITFGLGDFDFPNPESIEAPPSDGPGELKSVDSRELSPFQSS